MSSSNNTFKFPQTIQHGKNGSSARNSNWNLEETMVCQDANVSDQETTNLEKETMNKLMLKVYNKQTYNVAGTKLGSTKLVNKFGGCQSISTFKCAYPECPRKYNIFRSHGKLAAYSTGGHNHSKVHDRKSGVSNDVKGMLLSSTSVIDTFSELEGLRTTPSGKTEIVRLLGIDQQLDESYKKKMHSAWQTLKSDEKYFPKGPTHTIPLGTDMETLTKSMNTYKMTVEDFAATSRTKLAEMNQDEKNELVVLSTDIGENEDHSFNHFAFTTYASLETFDAAIDSAKTRDAAMQFEADYAHNIMNFKEVGSLGISDLSKRYHSLIWDINVTENSTGSGRLVDFCNRICEKRGFDGNIGCNTKKHKLLSDGAKALKNAAEDNKFLHLLCLSHMIRSGLSAGGAR